MLVYKSIIYVKIYLNKREQITNLSLQNILIQSKQKLKKSEY